MADESSKLAEGLYPDDAAKAAEAAKAEEAKTAEAAKGEAEAKAKAEADAAATAKTPEQIKADEAAKAVEAAKAPQELKITAPEGVKLDEAKLTAASALMREAGITDPAQAQKLADFYFNDVAELSKQAETASRKAWEDLQAQWKTELAADPELGGDKAVEAQRAIGRAIDEYGSKEVREAFDSTGAGNNPHIARMIHKMAKALSEGGIVAGGRPRQAPKSLGESLYGPEKGQA